MVVSNGNYMGPLATGNTPGSGIGIEKTEINADGELIVTYTDGNSVNLGKVVGADGAQGPQGIQGIQGETGAKGDKGDKGEKGEKGDPYTLNEADKAEIVAAAEAVCVAKNQGAANVGKILVVGTDGNLTLTDMPEGGASGDVIGVLDESNNILLSGNLADGTYTLKYENADGTYTDIGTLEVGAIPEPEPTKTNFIEYNTDNTTDWSIWCNDARVGSDGAYRLSTTQDATNYIPVQNGDIIYINQGRMINGQTIGLYSSSKAKVSTGATTDLTSGGHISEATSLNANTLDAQFTITNASVAFIRFTLLRSYTVADDEIVVNIKRNGEWL